MKPLIKISINEIHSSLENTGRTGVALLLKKLILF